MSASSRGREDAAASRGREDAAASRGPGAGEPALRADGSAALEAELPPLPGARGPSPIVAWWRAIRPHTLGGALAPVLVGSAAALDAGGGELALALLCAGAAVSMQIAANLANDAFDSLHGIDGTRRSGPARAVQQGWLPAQAVLGASGLALAFAALCGVYLVWRGGWPILALGLLSIAAAWGYSSGPFPLASRGLGELAAFAFFGLLAVCGTTYLQLGELTPLAVLASAAVGALISNLMLVNNLRDLESDAAAGKRTLAVQLGPRRARWLYAVALAIAYTGAFLVFVGPDGGGPERLLPLATLPWGWRLARAVQRASRPEEFTGLLARSARLHAAISVLLALGLAS